MSLQQPRPQLRNITPVWCTTLPSP